MRRHYVGEQCEKGRRRGAGKKGRRQEGVGKRAVGLYAMKKREKNTWNPRECACGESDHILQMMMQRPLEDE
jgi:hypothetical protein